MSNKVDEAVAQGLLQMGQKRTGIKEVDEFLDQALITLGGLVKISDMIAALDVHPTKQLLMKMNLKAYDSIIKEIAFEVLGQ